MTHGGVPFVVGLNHRAAPVELRERLAVGSTDLQEVLTSLQSRFHLAEVAVLSTCNRVEIYGVPGPASPALKGEGAARMLFATRSVSAEPYLDYVYEFRGEAAIRHLYTVASSLDSMVIGETEILSQVKAAYTRALEEGTTGPLLNEAFQAAFRAAKRVQSETHLTQGRVSVAGVAMDFVRRVFSDFSDKTVLLIGSGEMGRLALTYLMENGVRNVLIANRTLDRAETLAHEVGGTAVPFDRLDHFLPMADIVVASTAAPRAIIDQPRMRAVMRRRKNRPVFVMDIAVPRNVAPEVGDLEDLYLYDIDDMETVVREHAEARQGEVLRSNRIIDEELVKYVRLRRSADAGPAIVRLSGELREVAQGEMERLVRRLPDLDEKARAEIGQAMDRMVAKILHRPIETLKADARDGRGAETLEAMARLFGWEGRDGDA